MNNRLVFLGLLMTISFVAAGCRSSSNSPTTDITPPPQASATTPPVSPAYPEDLNPVRMRSLHTVCDPQNFICVGRELVNATLPIPFTATGTAIAFENTFQWKLLDKAGTEVTSGTLMAESPDIGQPGAFTLNYNLKALRTGPHILRFYESSAKDGSPIHVLDIPVRF